MAALAIAAAAVAIAALSVAAAVAADAGAAIAQRPPAAGTGRCAAQVERQLRAWQVVAPARPQPPAGAMSVRHWATPRLGAWVVEAQGPDGARATLVSAETVTAVEWSPACTAATATGPRPGAAAPRFNDADLAVVMAAAPRGVIYSWSPHMPLSVDGYRAVTTAAAERGLAVEVVLDPGGDRDFAAAAQSGGGLPPSALRVADSVELLFRDVHVHAPAVQAWAGGRLIGSAFPGFHRAAEYGAFLESGVRGSAALASHRAGLRAPSRVRGPARAGSGPTGVTGQVQRASQAASNPALRASVAGSQRSSTSCRHCAADRLRNAHAASCGLKGCTGGSQALRHNSPMASAASRRAGVANTLVTRRAPAGSATLKRNRFGSALSLDTLLLTKNTLPSGKNAGK